LQEEEEEEEQQQQQHMGSVPGPQTESSSRVAKLTY